MKSAAIIAAAGSGERFGASIPKALIHLGDRTLIEHAVAAIAPVVDQIVVTSPAGYEGRFRELLGEGIMVVTGGVTRSASVAAGLAVVESDTDFVLVHDAARALASTHLARAVLATLADGESAVIPGLAQVDTVKVVDSAGYVLSTPDRATMQRVQTPQGFNFHLLKRAHENGGDATDDAVLVESLGATVRIIPGEERALKITTPADLAHAMALLTGGKSFATGVGVDSHRFGEGRELWLGCLQWPGEVGVEGHSDGDVAAHAICDALFAATQLGDLGSNFGVDKPEYAGASGTRLLQECASLIRGAGYSIENVSVQIIGNRPKIGKRRPEVIAAISAALGGVPVSVLATTTDGLGLTGEGKGIAAIASALVTKGK